MSPLRRALSLPASNDFEENPAMDEIERPVTADQDDPMKGWTAQQGVAPAEEVPAPESTAVEEPVEEPVEAPAVEEAPVVEETPPAEEPEPAA